MRQRLDPLRREFKWVPISKTFSDLVAPRARLRRHQACQRISHPDATAVWRKPVSHSQPFDSRRIVRLVPGHRQNQLGNSRREGLSRRADAAMMHHPAAVTKKLSEWSVIAVVDTWRERGGQLLAELREEEAPFAA